MSRSATTRTMIMSAMEVGMMNYSKYDADDRLEWILEAPAGSKDGDPAMLTMYKYDGSSSVIVATKEIISSWDSAYDFDTLDPFNLP